MELNVKTVNKNRIVCMSCVYNIVFKRNKSIMKSQRLITNMYNTIDTMQNIS